MKAFDTVNKVELEVTRDDLIQLMRDGRQVDFVMKEPTSDADGYMTWDVEFWSAVDEPVSYTHLTLPTIRLV